MDQRRADAVWTCSAGSPTATSCPGCSPRREREVGIVLHADTLFGDGPGKNATGELRGLGAPAPIDPHSAAGAGRGRDRRRRRDPRPAGGQRRCPAAHPAPAESTAGWLDPRPPGRPSPSARSRTYPSLQTDSYEPTVAITEHVRAVHPRCTSYDCARLAVPLRSGPRRVLAPRTHLRHQSVSPLPAPPRAQDPRPRAHTPAPRRLRHHHNPARHHRHHPTRTRARLRHRRGLRHPALSLTSRAAR